MTFSSTGQWAMTSIGLGASSTSSAQSIVFGFAAPEDATSSQSLVWVASNLPGVNPTSFPYIWGALQKEWQAAMVPIGTAGIPLPRIPGFDFLATDATVEIVPGQGSTDGYLSVLADITYVS